MQLNIHGATPAPIDPAQLPYSQNGAAGPNWLIPASIVASLVMLALNYFGVTHIAFAIVAAPPVLLALHVLSLIRIRNAVHIALGMHAHDQKLNFMVQASIDNMRQGHLSQERLQRITEGRGNAG